MLLMFSFFALCFYYYYIIIIYISPMNSLLILFGESFRLGGQGNRNRGSEE